MNFILIIIMLIHNNNQKNYKKKFSHLIKLTKFFKKYIKIPHKLINKMHKQTFLLKMLSKDNKFFNK